MTKIKFHAIGGYNEVGKNMSALQIGKDVFIMDCGLFLPPVVELEEKHTASKLRAVNALPDDSVISKLKKDVKGFFVTHAHLDHVGALPYVAPAYKAPIYGTPFTIEVLNTILRDNQMKMRNMRKAVQPNSSVKVGKTKVEFVNITHSTLQTSLIVFHTDKGAVIYANDFKFDNTPIVGKKPNYKRLKEIASEGVLALIVDSLYASDGRKTPSEKIARDLLQDVLFTTRNDDACIVVTTFSSHIARLKSIVEFGKRLGRKIIFLGRSLHKYVGAASRLKLINFNKDVKVLTYKNDMERALRQVMKKKEDYMIVCTGHQGEEGSILVRLANDMLPFRFSQRDHVIFSSRTIPSPINLAQRKQLEKSLKEKGVRLFDDVHVSGHCGREDLRDMIELLQPLHIVPAHGDMSKLTALAELASELGYDIGKEVHLMRNGQSVEFE